MHVVLAQTLSEGSIKILAEAGAVTVISIALLIAMCVLLFMCWAVYRGFTGFTTVQRETNAQTLMMKSSIDTMDKNHVESSRRQIELMSKSTEELSRATHMMALIERRLDDTATKFSDATDVFGGSIPPILVRLEEAIERFESAKNQVGPTSFDINLKLRIDDLISVVRQFVEEKKQDEKSKTAELPVVGADTVVLDSPSLGPSGDGDSTT